METSHSCGRCPHIGHTSVASTDLSTPPEFARFHQFTFTGTSSYILIKNTNVIHNFTPVRPIIAFFFFYLKCVTYWKTAQDLQVTPSLWCGFLMSDIIWKCDQETTGLCLCSKRGFSYIICGDSFFFSRRNPGRGYRGNHEDSSHARVSEVRFSSLP